MLLHIYEVFFSFISEANNVTEFVFYPLLDHPPLAWNILAASEIRSLIDGVSTKPHLINGTHFTLSILVR